MTRTGTGAVVPETLLAALGPEINNRKVTLKSSPLSVSSTSLYNVSRAGSASPLGMSAVLTQSDRDRPTSLLPTDGNPPLTTTFYHPPRQSMTDSVDTRAYQDSQTRTSEDGDGRLTGSDRENRDSVPSKSGVVVGLTTVSEHGPPPRRASDAHTFGAGGSDHDAEANSREHSFSVDRSRLSPAAPSPTSRFSVADSDALRRQSMRSSKLSKEGEMDADLEKGDLGLPERETKQEPLRTSDDAVPRSSSVHRLTLNTTADHDSSNGYPDAGYGSSNGHSEYWKKSVVNQSHIPRSSYYVGPPALGSAFGTDPMGEIGLHFPREIVRIERDYSGGELVQLYPTYPLEFEGRVTPTQLQASINEINEVLISAHSLRHSAFEHILGVMTLYVSTLVVETHYEKEMKRLARVFERLNREVFNPVGLNLLWPRKVAFLFLEIEYY